jgi:hypothetical protein
MWPYPPKKKEADPPLRSFWSQSKKKEKQGPINFLKEVKLRYTEAVDELLYFELHSGVRAFVFNARNSGETTYCRNW